MTAEKKAAFESLALPLMNKLYSYAFQMTKEQMDAEDLVQETYMKAYRFFDNFKQGSNFQAWLFRILVNSYIDLYNKKKRRDTKIASYSHEEADKNQAREDDRVETELYLKDYDKIFGDEISRALSRLPEHYRMVVLLSDVNDFKYKEIARMLNCPIGTVMSRLNRGRRILARHLKTYAVKGGVVSPAMMSTA